MALFDQTTPLSQFRETPDLLPYATTLTKRNGKPTGVKKALDWLLPAAGAVVGTVIAPGIGTKIGASLGTTATSAFNRSERRKAEEMGAKDALQNIDNSLGSTMSAGNLVNMASGLVNFTPGVGQATSSLQSVDPMADVAGLGQGALEATGMTDYRNTLNSFTDTLTKARQDSARQWNMSFNPSAVNPSDLLSAGLAIPALSQSPSLPMKTRYGTQRFADGGIVEPLNTTALPLNSGGRERRRQKRLADGLAERVNTEVDLFNQANAAAADQRIIDNYYQTRDQWRMREPIVTKLNSYSANDANYLGAEYVRNWMREKGAGTEAENVMTPNLLRPKDYYTNTDSYDTFGAYMPKRDQSYVMNDILNNIGSTSVHESTHDMQDAMLNNESQQDSLARIDSRIKDNKRKDPRFGTPGEVQSRLMEMRYSINQNPNEQFNRGKWRLNNILNALTLGFYKGSANRAFRQAKRVMGRENVFQSLNDTFKEGGKPMGRYNRYQPGDKTEDIDMIDKRTGDKIGEMRYNERIYDQSASDTIDKMVDTLRMSPSSKGFEWLGKFVFDETSTHKDHAQRFADGGKLGKPDPNLEKIQRELKAAGYYSGPVDGITTTGIEQGITKWNKQPDLPNAQRLVGLYDEKDNFIGADFTGEPEAGTTQVSDPTMSNSGDDASFVVQKPTMLAPVEVKAKAPERKAPTIKTSIPSLADQSALVQPVTYIPPVDRPSITVPAPARPNTMLGGLNAIPDLSNRNSTVKPVPYTPVKPSSPITPVQELTPTTIAKEKKPAQYNWLNANNIMNAGRVVTGLLAANTPYPDEIDTSKLDTLVAEAEARRNQGLSAASRALANDALADNRSTAYEALRRNMGGGGASGAILAGLGQIGQTEVAGDLALANANEAQQERNRFDYQRLLGARMDIDNQRFNRQFDAVQSTRQAGLNLIPQGLQGITDDYQYWNAYENPNSAQQRYLNGQIRLQDEYAKIASAIYKNTANGFLNSDTTPVDSKLKSSAPLPDYLKPSVSTPAATPDFRTILNLPSPYALPIVPYRPR